LYSLCRYISSSKYKLVTELPLQSSQQITAMAAINGFLTCILHTTLIIILQPSQQITAMAAINGFLSCILRTTFTFTSDRD
jgi:hypothetical protein